MELRTCINCGKEITLPFARKYCGKPCRRKANNDRYVQSGYFAEHGKRWREKNKQLKIKGL
jgi:hypothetical protein